MRAFADLYAALDETTKTNEKVEALVEYLSQAQPADAAWAVYFLTGRKPKRLVGSRKLWSWAVAAAGIPEWLFAECYEAVGDIAETIALLLPFAEQPSLLPLSHWIEHELLPLREKEDWEQRRSIVASWRAMDRRQRLVWNKLLTGEFRVGVSQQLVVRALARASGVPATVVAHRLMGEWQPTPEFYQTLTAADSMDGAVSRPYPFFLAHPFEGDPAGLGDIREWQVEWKWDGIRSQLIRRQGRTFLWSRGEELVTERYPEIIAAGDRLPEGTALDGEILPWSEGKPLPFAQLQRRIGRKDLGKRILRDVPVVLVAYDVLEDSGQDVREQPLEWRRAELEAMLDQLTPAGCIVLSPTVTAASWDELAALRETSRERHVEGLMLKRLGSPYRVGRVRGDWWKWKVHPFTVDAVLIYAQPGHGKRASLFTDYTFGVWHAGELVPVAKAYSGLNDAEIRRVDAFVRRNTIEKFGPVRTVKPELVFELGFEAIARSTRHKSGIAVRFPRMLRWRTDKKIEEADTLERLQELLPKKEARGKTEKGPDLFSALEKDAPNSAR
jgi:DNA ligase-1